MCVYRRLFGMMNNNKKKLSSSIQSLYDLCKDTFTTTPPPPSNAIQKLSSLLDTIGPTDVGLSEDSKEEERGHGSFGVASFARVDRWAQPITYVDIHEGEAFTMCIFCFPTSAVIPLHNHPGMTVLSKVLYGSLHVKAYDWVEPARIKKVNETNYSTVRLAKLAVDNILTAPCSTSVLYPKNGGNLHCFTAITPCAVLDILAPPYNEYAGRRCTYFRDYPFSSFLNGSMVIGTGIKLFKLADAEGDEDLDDEEYAWLAEVDAPDIYMRSGTYTGPPIEI